MDGTVARQKPTLTSALIDLRSRVVETGNTFRVSISSIVREFIVFTRDELTAALGDAPVPPETVAASVPQSIPSSNVRAPIASIASLMGHRASEDVWDEDDTSRRFSQSASGLLPGTSVRRVVARMPSNAARAPSVSGVATSPSSGMDNAARASLTELSPTNRNSRSTEIDAADRVVLQVDEEITDDDSRRMSVITPSLAAEYRVVVGNDVGRPQTLSQWVFPNLRFGVEMETLLYKRADELLMDPNVKAIRDVAPQLNAMLGRGYEFKFFDYEKAKHDRSFNIWKITTDMSIKSEDGRSIFGLEFITPILEGRAGLAQLERAANALITMGFATNNTTAVHVHIGCERYSNEQIRTFAEYQLCFEHIIDQFMTVPRRSDYNRYCRSNLRTVTSTRDPVIACEKLRELDLRQSINPLVRLLTPRLSDVQNSNRNHKVNFFLLRNTKQHEKGRRIELRQHQGTCDPHVIGAWVALMTTWLDKCVNADRIRPHTGTFDEFWAIIDNPALRTYYTVVMQSLPVSVNFVYDSRELYSASGDSAVVEDPEDYDDLRPNGRAAMARAELARVIAAEAAAAVQSVHAPPIQQRNSGNNGDTRANATTSGNVPTPPPSSAFGSLYPRPPAHQPSSTSATTAPNGQPTTADIEPNRNHNGGGSDSASNRQQPQPHPPTSERHDATRARTAEPLVAGSPARMPSPPANRPAADAAAASAATASTARPAGACSDVTVEVAAEVEYYDPSLDLRDLSTSVARDVVAAFPTMVIKSIAKLHNLAFDQWYLTQTAPTIAHLVRGLRGLRVVTPVLSSAEDFAPLEVIDSAVVSSGAQNDSAVVFYHVWVSSLTNVEIRRVVQASVVYEAALDSIFATENNQAHDGCYAAVADKMRPTERSVQKVLQRIEAQDMTGEEALSEMLTDLVNPPEWVAKRDRRFKLSLASAVGTKMGAQARKLVFRSELHDARRIGAEAITAMYFTRHCAKLSFGDLVSAATEAKLFGPPTAEALLQLIRLPDEWTQRILA